MEHPEPPAVPAPIPDPGRAIQFWFDFSSAYAFFAARRIEELAAAVQRPVLWYPYMLGTAFKATGVRGLSSTPLKKDYARNDWQRIAREQGISFNLPERHPLVALAATRAFYWIDERDADTAKAFASRVFDTYYTTGLDTSDAEAMADLAASLGVDRDGLIAGLGAAELKERVRAISDHAVAHGIFGSPFFVVDGEPFWGWDRMEMMERWIRQGGW